MRLDVPFLERAVACLMQASGTNSGTFCAEMQEDLKAAAFAGVIPIKSLMGAAAAALPATICCLVLGSSHKTSRITAVQCLKEHIEHFLISEGNRSYWKRPKNQ